MTTTLTVSADDFTGSGLQPAADTEFQLNALSIAVGANRITSTKRWTLRLDAFGVAKTLIPDSQPGEGLQIWSKLRGWNERITVAGYPSGNITLVELMTEYRVDPTTLKDDGAQAPEAWWVALKGYVRTINGQAPDANGNITVAGDGSIGVPAPTLTETDTKLVKPHVLDETPHPAYDDFQDLTLLFENRLL
jgi:hypothetical protein